MAYPDPKEMEAAQNRAMEALSRARRDCTEIIGGTYRRRPDQMDRADCEWKLSQCEEIARDVRALIEQAASEIGNTRWAPPPFAKN